MTMHYVEEIKANAVRRPATGLDEECKDWKLRAHDIKNIVASLSMIAEELEQSPQIRSQELGRRVSRCNEKILSLCTGKPTLSNVVGRDTETRTIHEILNDVVELADSVATRKTKLSLRGAAPVTCVGTTKPVFRILSNLVTNAVLAVNHNGGGTVTLFSSIEGEDLVIYVADNGPGMFSSGVASSKKEQAVESKLPEGRGIGLMIAEVLSYQLGGKLSLVSTGNRNTTLRFTVPIAALDQTDRSASKRQIPNAMSLFDIKDTRLCD